MRLPGYSRLLSKHPFVCVMLLSLLSHVVLAGLVASSGTITCFVLEEPIGTLFMKCEEDGVVPPPPAPVGLVNNVLQTQPSGTPTSFTFLSCTSSFVAMDPPDANPQNVTYSFG